MSAAVAQCAAVPNVGIMNTLVTMLVESLLAGQCNIAPPSYWPPDYAEEALAGGLGQYDFVVVGAGSAGSVVASRETSRQKKSSAAAQSAAENGWLVSLVASRLSENTNWNVLVLEAGGDPSLETEVPNLFFGIQHTNFAYNYFVEPNGRSCKAFKDNKCYWPRGKGIGGTGAINAMLYYSGNRGEYDKWLQAGNTGWGFNDIYPYFQKSITPAGNASFPMGHMAFNDFETHDADLYDLLFDAAAEMGFPIVTDFAEGSYIGYGKTKGSVENGHRASTGKGHLGKVSQRPNLKVIKNAQVTKLNFDASGKRVESISFVVQGQTHLTVTPRKEVILSAGTIDTPKILMLSGVGPQEVLQPLNIPVVKQLPIGQNLQDHVVGGVFLRIDGQLPDPQQTLNSIYNYLMSNNGPLSSTSTAPLTAFLRTNPTTDVRYPDTEIHHLSFRRGDAFAMSVFLNGISVKEELQPHFMAAIQDYDIMAVLIINSKPKSSGTIKLKTASYLDDPIIDANYLADQEDMNVLLRGFHHVMNMENTTALQARNAQILHIPLPECDQFAFKSDDYWKCYASYFSLTCYHHVGTVKMGSSTDATACVDPRLKLKGFENVRVVDASIMPYVSSVNTNGPTVMIAEKASDMIKEDHIQS